VNWKQQIHFANLNKQRDDRREKSIITTRAFSMSQTSINLLGVIYCATLSVSILWLLWQFVFNKELISPIQICYILSLIHTTALGQLSFFLIKTTSV